MCAEQVAQLRTEQLALKKQLKSSTAKMSQCRFDRLALSRP